MNTTIESVLYTSKTLSNIVLSYRTIQYDYPNMYDPLYNTYGGKADRRFYQYERITITKDNTAYLKSL